MSCNIERLCWRVWADLYWNISIGCPINSKIGSYLIWNEIWCLLDTEINFYLQHIYSKYHFNSLFFTVFYFHVNNNPIQYCFLISLAVVIINKHACYLQLDSKILSLKSLHHKYDFLYSAVLCMLKGSIEFLTKWIEA